MTLDVLDAARFAIDAPYDMATTSPRDRRRCEQFQRGITRRRQPGPVEEGATVLCGRHRLTRSASSHQ